MHSPSQCNVEALKIEKFKLATSKSGAPPNIDLLDGNVTRHEISTTVREGWNRILSTINFNACTICPQSLDLGVKMCLLIKAQLRLGQHNLC